MIEAVLVAELDNAFTIEDLCQRVYKTKRVEKTHRVAVLRAAANLAKRRDTLHALGSGHRGGTLVYFNCDNVLSYAMARLKADSLNDYQNKTAFKHQRPTEAALRARISEGGENHRRIVGPDGTWWRYTQSNIDELAAKRAGDSKRLKQVLKQRAKAKAEARRRFSRSLTS